ncbi:hypothetical protein [Mycolicibacterium neoaurum]|uniref:hypothetical protein n=1 Tax=Mycolicibacterium neoaurum TaxID=1795 RepID=UPI001F4CADEC|nr:hypothetical protein [Mycolicibacterium neoaurum]
MEAVERMGAPRTRRPWRYGVAAVTLSAGLVVAPIHGVAWAEGSESTGGTGSNSAPADTTSNRPDTRSEETKNPADHGSEKGLEPVRSGLPDDREPGDNESADLKDHQPEAVEPDDDSTAVPSPTPEVDVPTPDTGEVIPPGITPDVDESAEPTQPEPGSDQQPEATRDPQPPLTESTPQPLTSSGSPTERDRDGRFEARPAPTSTRAEAIGSVGLLSAPLSQPALGTVTPPAALVEVTTPAPPQPLSPIAALIELPGRIVNAILQFLDFTVAATGPRSPFHIAPINDLLFAAFRELERWAGLHQTPAVQPALPTMVYTGPTDRPTPTVAQFLNASTAAYGLGTTPGGLVPLTVNGFQLQSTNIFSGMSGKAWVTPQGQVIIAYQGTTGGTNLLFNPLITIAQIVADLQVVLTDTTPWAFYDALDFARRVQEEAALQGYAPDDVFVTGHSLGGWEAQFVAQQTGLSGIGFEAPGMNTRVDGNGATSNFVNIAQYGSPVAFMSTDLPGLQPFLPPFVAGGGLKPHYGPIVMIGDRAAMNPIVNSAAMWGTGLVGSVIFAIDFFANFFQYHLMGVQAYHLDVDPDPGVVPWLGTRQGTVHIGYGELTIQELLKTASDDGILIAP